jgi:hypothetical protein
VTNNTSKNRIASLPTLRQWVITLACLFAGAGVVVTAESLQGTPAECATRDLKLVNLIEEHGAARDIASEQLAAAYFTMMEARNACRQGRVADALAIYDKILLAPGFARAGQPAPQP